jgi:hypothetical protein
LCSLAHKARIRHDHYAPQAHIGHPVLYSHPPINRSIPNYHHPLHSSSNCLGFELIWDVGTIFTTYPFQIHDPTSPHYPGCRIELQPFSSQARLRSDQCHRHLTEIGSICLPCSSLDKVVDKLKIRARATYSVGSHNSEASFSHTQLRQKLEVIKKEKDRFKLEVNLLLFRECLKLANKTVDTK